MELLLFTSAFCGACTATRVAVERAADYLPDATVTEIDIANDPDAAEAHDIRATPTLIVRDATGVEVFRSPGVPTVPQVLAAAAKALP